MMRRVAWVFGLAFAGLLGVGCEGDVEGGEVSVGIPCGPVECASTEYCCDASCGLCVAEEVACSDTCGE
jgi:hypothetical protein